MVDEGRVVREERLTMSESAESFTITIRKRPWWGWTVAGLWLLAELLFVQTAVGSMREGEGRAAMISWIVAAVLLAAGLVAWLRPQRTHKQANAQS
jgi:hypothetical protein